MSAPEPAELELSDSLIATIVADRPVIPAQPMVELLRATRGPATNEELLDTLGFARQVAAASASARRHAEGHVSSGRFRLVRRALAAKAALITGVAVLGVAGAGAATGVALLTAPETPRPTPVETPIATTDTHPEDSAGSTPGRHSGSALDRTWPSVSVAPSAQGCVTTSPEVPCTDPPVAGAQAAPTAGPDVTGGPASSEPIGGNGAGNGATNANPDPNANPNAAEGSDNAGDGATNANPNAAAGSDNAADRSANANPNAGDPGTNGSGNGNGAGNGNPNGNGAGNGAANANPNAAEGSDNSADRSANANPNAAS